MEGKFSYAGIDENKKGDDKQRKNILQIKKYDSQSLIFIYNDSFIANEKQAMREDVESEFENGADSNGQELQNEIDQLKIDLNEAKKEKRESTLKKYCSSSISSAIQFCNGVEYLVSKSMKKQFLEYQSATDFCVKAAFCLLRK